MMRCVVTRLKNLESRPDGNIPDHSNPPQNGPTTDKAQLQECGKSVIMMSMPIPKSLRLQSSELMTLTYGALVSQMLRDFENVDDVNKQLERLGYNMGVRLIEDFLARTNPGRCMDMKDTAEKVQQAFR